MNKKGNFFAIVMFLAIMMVAIFAIFITALGSGVITYVSQEITDATSDLGMVGDSNLSHHTEVTIETANTSIQMLSWGSGIIIVALLLGILIFAASIRTNPSKILIGVYLLMNILLIMTSIFLSNAYEEIYNSGDVLATEIQGMGMASFLVLYLPTIITVISFIGGIIIFAGIGEDFV